MGISSAEIGSLSYEEIMAYAKDGRLVNDTVNEKSTAELIFTNTSQEQDCRDSQTAIYQTSTNNIFTKQEETIEQEPSYTPFYAVAAGSSTSQFQTSNATNNNNIMDIHADWSLTLSPSNYHLFSENDNKLNDCQEATAEPFGFENTNNLDEKTYKFVSGDSDNNTVLTSTQEIIDAGISSEDFHLHENPLYDEQSTSNTTNEFNHDFVNFTDLKLEVDPMMGFDINQPTSTVQSTEHVVVYKESDDEFITLGETEYLAFIEIDELSLKSSSPDLQNNRINNSSKFKLKENKETVVCNSAKSPKRPKLPKLNLSRNIVPELVNTAEFLDNAVSLLESEELKNRNIKFITATSSTSTTILDISNNTTSDYCFVDEVTQSSLLSPVSKYNYSAPPTPSSSYEFNPERKRRGRPPKTHSTLPDPEELNRLTPSDRKYLLHRCKNNEASRQSRLNRKRKQDKNSEEEEKLVKDHDKLTYEHDKWLRIETKLKAMLQKCVIKTE